MKSRTQQKKVFIAMSGGVDSSVTAALLKARGFDVRGVHIKMWSPMESLRDSTGQADPFFPVCQQQYQDRIDAMKVAAHLDIPFETWDLTREYKKEVVDYMVNEYAKGRTPNPDVMCNRKIKFGVFLARALGHGADFVATGHYVRQEPEFPISNFQFPKKPKIQRHDDQSEDDHNFESSYIENSLRIENCKLKIARDLNKDQSYFLWALTPEQLKHCMFPIGEYTKPEVRAMAKKFGLPTAEKPDSQGICFIGEIDLRSFLKNYIPEKRGVVLTTSGKKVGEHEGLNYYTIGQRQGIGIGGGIPYYVASKDFRANTLVVAEGPYDKKLFKKNLIASGLNWISGKAPKLPLTCRARVRYRQPLQEAKIIKQGSGIKVTFKDPQRAITSGQSVVFYKGNPSMDSTGSPQASSGPTSEDFEMLGGGIIL